MDSLKETFYDWNGANVWLFKQVNGLSGDVYDSLMILLSRIADHRHFPYYLAGVVAFALISYLVKKIRRRGGTPQHLAAWFGVVLVLMAGYAAEGITIKAIKNYCEYPRPYIALAQDHVRVLEVRPGDDNYHSFPSGHVAFITLMVMGLWPVLCIKLRWFGAFLIPAVMWSRMAMGVHFPADVLAGFLLTFSLVLILRGIIYMMLLKLFRLKC